MVSTSEIFYICFWMTATIWFWLRYSQRNMKDQLETQSHLIAQLLCQMQSFEKMKEQVNTLQNNATQDISVKENIETLQESTSQLHTKLDNLRGRILYLEEQRKYGYSPQRRVGLSDCSEDFRYILKNMQNRLIEVENHFVESDDESICSEEDLACSRNSKCAHSSVKHKRSKYGRTLRNRKTGKKEYLYPEDLDTSSNVSCDEYI